MWRSLPTDENEAAQEDDDELMIEGFSSNWEQGMVVKVMKEHLCALSLAYFDK